MNNTEKLAKIRLYFESKYHFNMRHKRITKELIEVRKIAFYVSRVLTGISFTIIGKELALMSKQYVNNKYNEIDFNIKYNGRLAGIADECRNELKEILN